LQEINAFMWFPARIKNANASAPPMPLGYGEDATCNQRRPIADHVLPHCISHCLSSKHNHRWHFSTRLPTHSINRFKGLRLIGVSLALLLLALTFVTEQHNFYGEKA
jgi:hypothetical protein